MCLSLGSIRATVDSEPVELSSEPLIGNPSNIVDTIDRRLTSRESFKSDQLRLIGIGESREVGEREMIQRTALAKYR